MLKVTAHHPFCRNVSRMVLPFLFQLAMAATVLASEEAGAHGEMPSIISMSMFWRVINFTVLAVVLYKFLAKPMQTFFVGRREEIIASLEEARRNKEEAEARYRELSQRLQNRDREFEEIRRTAAENAEKLKERMIAEAHEKAQKLEEKAKASIEQEVKQAREDLKREAAEIALKMAEDNLMREITPADHRRFMDEYLAGLK
jgi:F-type H+-transporting ATPase subunit b